MEAEAHMHQAPLECLTGAYQNGTPVWVFPFHVCE